VAAKFVRRTPTPLALRPQASYPTVRKSDAIGILIMSMGLTKGVQEERSPDGFLRQINRLRNMAQDMLMS
jgi:hypothetical protein